MTHHHVTTGDNCDRVWLADTLTRVAMRYARALHALSMVPAPLALARLWDSPEAADVQDAAAAIEQTVQTAIDELGLLSAYVVAITDPGQASCVDCAASVSFHGRDDFRHWRWAADLTAPFGRRVETFDAGHDPRPVWGDPPRPDWSEQDTDLTAEGVA